MIKYYFTLTFLFFSVFLFADDVTGVVKNASTPNCADGSIDLFVSNGVEPYTYVWTGPNGFSATTQDINGLLPGAYTIVVEDAACGRVVLKFEVKVSSLTVYVADKKNSSYCSEEDFQCDGYIALDAANINNLTFNWSGPEGFSSSERKIEGLCPGWYTVTVTSASGCTMELSEQICCCGSDYDPTSQGTEPLPVALRCNGALYSTDISLTGQVTSPEARTSGNGSINITVSRGNGQNIYIWTGPNGFKANTEDLSGLSVAGIYCVTITDGCIRASKCFTVVYCSESMLNVSGNITHTCSGVSFGSITAIATGGTAPYTYRWNNGFATPSIQRLAAGQYCVTVKDASGCTQSKCFFVSPSTPFANIPGTSPCGITSTCNGFFTSFQPRGSTCGFFDDPFSCRVENCRCSVTGGVTSSVIRPYRSFRFNARDCQILGLCPNSNIEEVAAQGTFQTELVARKLPNCNCFGCFERTFCNIPGSTPVLTSVRSVSININLWKTTDCGDGCLWQISCSGQLTSSFCGACVGGGGKPSTGNVEDLSFGQYMKMMIETGDMSDTTKISVPDFVTINTPMTEYNKRLSLDTLWTLREFQWSELDSLFKSDKPKKNRAETTQQYFAIRVRQLHWYYAESI